MTTEIWLIRHGETPWNRARRLQGWKDIPLNEEGASQAAKLARRLTRDAQTGPFEAIYSSDLQRAHDTAQAAADLLQLRVRPEPGLRERCYGVLEGLAMDELEQHQPEAAAAWRSREPDRQLEGGESLRQFRDRVVTTMEDVVARHPDARVLLFAHGGVLDIAWRHAQRIPLNHPRDAVLLNTAVNRLSHADGHWSIMGWGDISHIDAAGDDIV
ncbi:histidine phosphatase family protein [Achromobacter aloeverae]|uniref:Histidine phosphatase family protein n=1 Tax=Achromobacter aloeverae TaxID=1750518 RepID=A0A4V1MRS5_9BURK|nr:histidine phosphatase family protein [Achromobacter aloeverae]RXN86071.1 histidine phosphatase family protein [Achromobacter aloeverae]